MKNNNLLVICEAYATFQKDPTDIMANYFKNVSVFVKYNPIAEISRYISLPALNPFNSENKVNLINKPSNLNVYLTPVLYTPSDSQYKKLGENLYKATDKIIKNHNIYFNLIHSHFTWPTGYVGMKLKEKYNVPFVVTVHGYDIYYLPFKDELWMEKIRSVLNSADHIITVSNKNLELIKKLNVNTPATVLPNGFKSDIFYMQDSTKCRKMLDLPVDMKIILSIGNLAEVKGHKYLIKAMQEIITSRKDILCVIIGTGPLERDLKKQINSAKLQNYVVFAGKKSHTEIPLWINACDLLVLPSLSEGNPTVMFECLGCGKPLIGTKVGGIPEIIKSNDYGLLVEPGNVQELAEKIAIGLNSKWDGRKILDYSEQYRWDNIASQIMSVYFEVFLKRLV